MAYRLGIPKIFRLSYRKYSQTASQPSSILELVSTNPIGETKTVKGWINSVRKLKNIVFLDISDGSCSSSLQIVASKKIFTNSAQWGASIAVTGKIQINSKGKVELEAEDLTVVGGCDVTDSYPITPGQKHSYDYYRQYLHLRPRASFFSSMLRFRNAASFEVHKYFNKNGFLGIHTPIITSNDCEGAGELFAIIPQSKELLQSMTKGKTSDNEAFFGSTAYLTVSGQLHLEIITRCASKVYTFNPSFRAENSKSRLHLSEFYMVEAEEAFVTEIKSILHTIEDFVKHLISYLTSNHFNEIELILKHNDTEIIEHMKMLENIIDEPFTIMTFSEAKAIIKKNSDKFGKNLIITDANLTKEEELFLVKHNNNIPIFIIDWPGKNKPFYMKSCYMNPDLVQGVDLLVPNVGELCGGSLRESDYEILKEKLNSLGLLKSMEWYLELRKFGNVPTGGFGMGFERFLQFLLNIGNIKDTIPFPRWPHGLKL